MLKFTSVCLSSSFYARPSRSCLPPLLQELTTMTEQALQPPQTPELTPSYQCLSCAGCRTTAAASPVLRRKKKIRSLGIDQGAFCLLAGMLNMPDTRTLTTLSSLMLLFLGSPLPIVLLRGPSVPALPSWVKATPQQSILRLCQDALVPAYDALPRLGQIAKSLDGGN